MAHLVVSLQVNVQPTAAAVAHAVGWAGECLAQTRPELCLCGLVGFRGDEELYEVKLRDAAAVDLLHAVGKVVSAACSARAAV